MPNATATTTPRPVGPSSRPVRFCTSSLPRSAIAGSPIQPSPRLAKVMASCVTPRYRSRWTTAWWSCSSVQVAALRFTLCVARSFTSANSAATKKPFSTTKRAARPSPSTALNLLDSGLAEQASGLEEQYEDEDDENEHVLTAGVIGKLHELADDSD